MPTGNRTAVAPQSNRTLTALLAVLVTVALGWVLYVAGDILKPLVIALLLCTMLQPVVRALARWRIPSWVTVLALLAILVGGLERGGTYLYSSLRAFIQPYTQPQPVAAPPETGPIVEGGAGPDQQGLRQLVEKVQDQLVDWHIPEEVAAFLTDIPDKVDLAFASNVLGTARDFVQALFFISLYMLFIFAEQAVFRRKILAVAGPRQEDAAKVLDGIVRGIQRYLGVKTVISLMTGVCCFFGLMLLDVPYAALFGVLAFLFNYIPVFGSIVAGFIPAITAFATYGTWSQPAMVIALYVVVNVLLAYIVEPRILGRELNVSPLVVLVSVLVWSSLWGVVGTFLAVPLTCTLQIILANIPATRPVAILLSSGPPSRTARRA